MKIISPKPLQKLTPETCKKILGIFTDIDDTVSLHGKIPKEAFTALHLAKEAGLRVIPVTGRPAGWVDHIVRMWPVDAVVGENGAFYFYLDPTQGRDGLLIRKFLQKDSLRASNQKKLWQLFDVLKKKHFPNLQVASDQSYREIDLAIDFCEDVPRMTKKDIQKIVDFFHTHKAQAKISSIHVNAWFGEHDKYSCCELLVRELYKENLEKKKSRYLYFGDSPNDEPFFQKFPHSVGVSNIKDFLPQLHFPPTYITKNPGGLGFSEAINWLLKHR